MAYVDLLVNGQLRSLEVDPATPLLFVLRNDLRLKAAKFGCGLEQCGACTVLVSGEPVLACGLPVGQVGQREITTLEGLDDEFHVAALRRAFAEERAAQCGYCVPGIIVAAAALLAWNDDPDDATIRRALAGNLCRCGAHARVLAAVRRAAREMRGEKADRMVRWTTIQAPPPADPAPADADASRSLQVTPQLDAWIRFEHEGRVTVGTGKVELGQGLTTALAMIAAEELDVALERIDVRTADTADGPNEFITAGSGSMEQSGVALRMAAADARARLLAEASRKLGVPASDLDVEDGLIRARGAEAAITYWQLQQGRRFEGDVADATPKAAALHRVVGRAAVRKEMQALVDRGGAFVHDLERPEMVHGRVVRPPRYESRLDSVDETSARALPGVLEVVRDGRFLAVVAAREEQAVAAADALRESARWTGGELAFGESELFDRLTGNPRRSLPVVEGSACEDTLPPIREPAQAAQTLRARYCRPYHMHAAIGPSAAVAEWVDERLTVWCHSQGVHLLRPSLARALGLGAESIRVVHVAGSGCYGHNGADDAAMDAAVLALAVPGRPVRVQWSREDEHGWEPYGSAMVIEMQASLDAAGRVSDWNHDAFSDTHMGRPLPSREYSGLLASWHREPPLSPPPKQPRTGFQVGIHRNADPLYAFGERRIAKHLVDGLPLRVSSTRGLGAYANVFAIESFMDELARAAGRDPVEFRIAHLEDERAHAVIRAAVDLAGARTSGEHRGRGLGFARYENVKAYAAIVVDLAVDERGGVQLERFSIAADAGEIVDPDGLANQLEGGAIQAASWTLIEHVRFERRGIASRDWETYPILGFPQVPEIETVLLDRPGLPFLGAGEATQGPTPGAIANAIFDATGVRLRELPFTPERVRAARPA